MEAWKGARHNSKRMQKDFFVLRGSLMPAVLVEIGYITNKKELNLLITPSYQAVVSKAVAGGITSFVAGYNKLVK